MSNCSGNNPSTGSNSNRRKGYYYRREIQPFEPDFTGNFWDISGTSIYNTNGCGEGFVGIGNSNPQYNLDVSGIVNVSNRIITYGISAEYAQPKYIIDRTGALGYPFSSIRVLGSTSAGVQWIDVSAGGGGGGSLPFASEWSEYLYYDTTLGSYQTGGGSIDLNRLHFGSGAGQTQQGSGAVALGYQAGQTQQGSAAISIGIQAGRSNQGINAIAIGYQAGISGEKSGAIAFGYQAGAYNQGTNSIAIGNFAGRTNQTTNSIIINATGVDLSSIDMSGLYIAPIRTGREDFILTYNTNSKEVRYTQDISLNNLDVSNRVRVNDLSATKIWTQDLSSINLQVANRAIITDLSATKIWTQDLSSVNLQVSNRAIINDLSANKGWFRDLSATNLQVSNRVIINDLSATKIWTQDLSSVNLQVSGNTRLGDISANNIDGSFNIIDTNDTNTYYPLFAQGSGYQRLRIDTNKLIYNPGLDRLGINRDPSYNLDVSGSFRTTTVIDRLLSSGTNGQVLTSTITGIEWKDISAGGSGGTNYWTLTTNGLDMYNNNNSNNGNIGIGTGNTTSIPYKLDVSGSARMRYIIDINATDGSNNSILIGTANGIRWSKDLSLNNLQVSNRAIITDLSATKIWSQDLSSVNLQVSNRAIITDLSATKIWSQDLSSVNLQVSGTVIANNIDGSFNIIDTNDNNQYNLLFSQGSGYKKLRVDTNKLVYNPGLDRLGINKDPSFNLDVSGSFGLNVQLSENYLFDVSGETRIQTDNIRYGRRAGNTNMGSFAIAIGYEAGLSGVQSGTIAIGYQAGYTNMGANSIAIGSSAGRTNQAANSIIINATGNDLVNTTDGLFISPIRPSVQQNFLYYNILSKEITYQDTSDFTPGKFKAYSLNQTNPDISMSTATKFYPVLVDGSGTVIAYIDNRDFVFDASRNRLGIGIADPSYNLDISGTAKITNQLLVGNVTTSSLTFDVVGDTRIQSDNIRFGTTAGNTSQGSYAIAIGFNAGAYTQLTGAVSIGVNTGQTAQGANAVAIGASAGQATQGGHSVAIGYLAGQTRQGEHAVAIGREAGAFEQGTYSIAIGYYAGRTGQPQNSIVLNATNSNLTGSSANGLFIAPIRATTPTMAISKALYYDTMTNEVLYGDISGGGGSGTNYWTLTGNDIYNNNSGNVGIGTTSSIVYKLDVSGETRIQSTNIRYGIQAGNTNQGLYGIAIGFNAARTNQQTSAIAIGYQAGQGTQGTNAIAIGASSATISQGSAAIAIGLFAGGLTQGINAVAIGNSTGYNAQGSGSVAIGYGSGNIRQSGNAVAVGINSGQNTQGTASIAIGFNAGQNTQGSAAIAIGLQAGQNTQGSNAIAIGINAGQSTQGSNSIAIGTNSGSVIQSGNSIAIGNNAGQNTQGSSAIAIGYVAGQASQGSAAVAIGNSAGMDTQGANAVAIGVSAGHTVQGQSGIGIGVQAGGFYQQSGGIAIGFQAGRSTQGINALSLGNGSGQTQQGSGAIAIGFQAGQGTQGTNSIAIGNLAGRTNQTANSIIINATGLDLSSMDVSGLFIAPVRRVNGITQALYYDTSTSEIVYGDISSSGGGGGTNFWTSSGSNLYNNTGSNIGINTTSPAFNLDISGSVRLTNDLKIGNSTTITKVINNVDGSMNIVNTCINPSVTDVYFTFRPDNSNVQIDISFANWGTNNVLSILDIKSAGRSTTQPRGCVILSGQIYADNSGSNQFDNFINVGLTRKDCSLTTSSPGPYTLRLTIDPTYQTDIYSGSINIINATSSTDITAVSIRKV